MSQIRLYLDEDILERSLVKVRISRNLFEMKFELFSEMKLKEDIPEHNLRQGTSAIIVDYCPRPAGQEDGYLLEILDENNLAFDVISVSASKIEVATTKVSQR